MRQLLLWPDEQEGENPVEIWDQLASDKQDQILEMFARLIRKAIQSKQEQANPEEYHDS